MTFAAWLAEQYGEDTRPDLIRMAREAWGAGQEEMRERAALVLDSGNPFGPDVNAREIRALPLEGDDE